MIGSKIVFGVISLCLPLAAVGCFYDDEPPRRLAPDPGPPPAETLPPTTDQQPSTSTGPMLAVIDTDQTLLATPGEGIGVFIEYAAGGRWHLSWACDTAITNKSCAFDVRVRGETGQLGNLDSSKVPDGAAFIDAAGGLIRVQTTTTENLHEVWFDGTPGAKIQVSATVDGVSDGAFLFFVQGGKVRGGYPGQITNPLDVQGDKP